MAEIPRAHGMKKTALIIGAGPAGLTAAYELATRTDIHPVVVEADPQYVGGISKTVNYKGNRIDIGGHRFFSKSDRVMKWWSNMLPVRLPNGASADITYQRSTRALTDGLTHATDKNGDDVLTVRPRKTRIIHGGTFFAYPVELSWDTVRKLGLIKMLRIGVTYVWIRLFPIKTEQTLEDFFINRFGTELYQTFFKSYTEKVWGVPCTELSAEWGAQRVKGLSITKAIQHALRKLLRIGALSGKGVETSLIEQFLYPTYGPGQMWEKTAQKVLELGGEIRMGVRVAGLTLEDGTITGATLKTTEGYEDVAADYIFTTTDVRNLATMLNAPAHVRMVSDGLQYRDFLTVGLLLDKKPTEPDGTPLTDTWMYIHEDSVHVGRVQLFHNWQPKLVANQKNGWIGLEYFVNEGDELWNMNDDNLVKLGTLELDAVGLSHGVKVIDGTVIRQPKAYPGYFGSYAQFDTVREYLDTIPNLFPIGRNGMHRYNNQDHSMLAAMEAVDLILKGSTDKSSLWSINTEDEYHEVRK